MTKLDRRIHARAFGCCIEKVWVLRDVGFDFQSASDVAFVVGEADSGAAELALALSGLLPCLLPATSVGRIGGWAAPEVVAGYVAPDPGDQICGLSVEAEVDWALAVSGTTLDRLSEPTRCLLDELEILPLAGRATDRLSSGQRQRLALASMLIAEPSSLVLDNCFSSLDRHAVQALRRHVARRQTVGQQTLVVGKPGATLSAEDGPRLTVTDGLEVRISGGDVEQQVTAAIPARRLALYESLAEDGRAHCAQHSLPDREFFMGKAFLPGVLTGEVRLSVDDFRAEAGSVVTVSGANGSGKSSLLSVLSGVEESAHRGRRERAERLCYLPPDGIPAWIAVLQRQQIWGGRVSSAPRAIEDLLKEDRLASIAAGGYRARENPWRRLWWLVSSIFADVQWLLLDEPTTGMDSEQGKLVKALIRAHADRGGGVIVVSHDRALLESVGDRFLEMDNGRITKDVPRHSQLAAARGGEVSAT